MADLVRQVGMGSPSCRIDTLDSRIWNGRSAASLGPIQRVERRGKHLLVADSSEVLVLHLGMTGQIQREEDSRRVRMRLCFEAGATLVLLDPRCWAKAVLLSLEKERPYFSGLGLGEEFWPMGRTGTWWRERMGTGRGVVKPALLRQNRVVGVGNIAASEMLWMAGIHPTTPLNRLSLDDWESIAGAAMRHVSETLERENADSLSYVNQGGENLFYVYGKRGEPCSVCGAPIERINQNARSTFFCPSCQEES